MSTRNVFVFVFLKEMKASAVRSFFFLLFPPEHSYASKDVGCRSNFDPSRPLHAQDTSFSVKSFLTAVCQGVQTLSTDIFVYHYYFNT